jgi:hypothetical protein
MIFSHVAAHLKQQHWTGVFIELLIVVLGVYIGLQAQDWNNAHQDRALERKYLVRLRDDIKLSIRNADSNIARMRRQNQLESEMLTDLATCRLEGAARNRFATGIFFFGRIETPPLVRGTIDELRSTGRLGLIRDEALRSKLANVLESSNYETGVLQMIVARSTPAIAHIDQRVVLKQPPGGFKYKSIVEHGVPDGSVEFDFPALCKDPRFAPAVSTVQELTHVAIEFNKELLDSFKALLPIIDRDLAGAK